MIVHIRLQLAAVVLPGNEVAAILSGNGKYIAKGSLVDLLGEYDFNAVERSANDLLWQLWIIRQKALLHSNEKRNRERYADPWEKFLDSVVAAFHIRERQKKNNPHPHIVSLNGNGEPPDNWQEWSVRHLRYVSQRNGRWHKDPWMAWTTNVCHNTERRPRNGVISQGCKGTA